MQPRDRAWIRESGVVTAYAAISVAATYPLAFHALKAIPRGGDAWQFYWNLWWVKRALVDLHTTPYFSAEVHAPEGASLYFHTLNLLPSAAVTPISATLGLSAAFNTIVFASFVLSGYCTYRLALYVLRGSMGASQGPAAPGLRAGAFLAGIVFAFSSYRFVHALGHLDLLCTFWIPLYALLLLKTLRERSWGNPVACGAVMAATALTSLYYLVFLIVWSLVAAMVQMSAVKDKGIAIIRVAVAAVTFGLVTSPLMWPLLMRGRTEGRVLDPAADVERFSTDVMALVTPSPLSWIGASFARSLHESLERAGTNLELVAFLGFTALALAVGTLMRRSGPSLLWLLTLVVFVAFALGPVPHVGGQPFTSWAGVMPYNALLNLPYGDLPRVPGRFIVVAHLALAVLAGWGATLLFAQPRIRRHVTLTAAVLCALIMLENVPVPFPIVDAAAPQYFNRLAGERDAGTVLEVPIPADPSAYPERMLYQTVHRQRVFGGYLSRSLPPLNVAVLPGFADFKRLTPAPDVIVDEVSNARAVLAIFGAGRVVIEKGLLKEPDVARARAVADALLGAAYHDDAEIVAYRVIAPGDSPALWLVEGWSYLEHLDHDGKQDRWRWISERARVAVAALKQTRVRLRLTAHAFNESRRIRISLAGSELTTIAVGLSLKRFETPPFELNERVQDLEIESLDGAESPGVDPRRLSIAVHSIALDRIPQD